MPNELRAETTVHIATVLRPHGIRGAVVVLVDPSVSDVLRPGVAVTIQRDDVCLSTAIRSVARHKAGLRISLREVNDRSEAEQLSGGRMIVTRDLLPAPAEGEYYDFDVLGCNVVATDGRELGMVSQIIPTGASDVYVVVGPYGEILVPAVAGAITSIDTDTRRVVIDPKAAECSGSTLIP